MSIYAIELRQGDDSFVPGTLHDELVPQDLVLVEAQWHAARIELVQELQRLSIAPERWPQSLHWDWSKKASDLTMLEAAGFAIECAQEWQGVMLTKSTTHTSGHAPTLGKPLIYVDYLEVAPWNWTLNDIGRRTKYKAIGVTLLREAVQLSMREDFDGRVGLHSLQQAESFYDRCGLIPLGRDPTKQHLMYFEFSAEGAHRFMDGGRVS